MAEPVQKVKVYKEEDRVVVAGILVKNGYKVWQGKEPKEPGKKSMDYCVYFQEDEQKA